MTHRTHREVRLTARPQGPVTDDLFEIVEVPVPEPGPGQVLVRNTVMAVAAVMRTLMDENNVVPVPAFEVGEPLNGPALGEVVAAPGTGLTPGDLVEHRLGWREYALLDADGVHRCDPGLMPDPAAYLSQGPTAWMGIVRGAEVRPGDTVFVTGAAGGVGSLAGQIARLRGAARVIGSTASQEKADRLIKEFGYDAVVIRGAGPIEEQLRAAAPEGIDALFDNVGGEQLGAAIAVANTGARLALVGALSSQLSEEGKPHRTEIDTLSLLARNITLRGVALHAHMDLVPEWNQRFGQGLRDGTLTFPHTRLHGIEQAPRALRELTEGRHLGAVLVEL
ncbi:MDR family NADP-dependent oxidoreductase [Streptomyces nigrescens]|uniref:NADP-dependent oxidoreductase n=1 Tax=Streptomyces nigrescens TaxID=1920 RepID=A0A640TJC9_STRNI|nr:NADP-dependent oxidoreductase [Streptomyces libani]WAT96973.1 NADP-dependent oxidoreductase [Streptomyces libani subsp. libani]GFE22396.1 NADP-dependent oxidoreductase [Streptomyces libani subsp. libani]GGV90819.1 NADP-dependent oxidoreductase [Streptomyces libani subsp. libani]